MNADPVVATRSCSFVAGHHCPDRPVVVKTGDWSRAGQRLGNTLGMLTMALITADRMHGALELLAPGNRYYNTTRFCTSESDVAVPADVVVKHELFHCYTPCKCGLGAASIPESRIVHTLYQCLPTSLALCWSSRDTRSVLSPLSVFSVICD